MDLGIEVILDLFSKTGLESIFQFVDENNSSLSENTERIFALKEEYIKTIDDVILFLQGKNQTLARQICSHNFLPEASRFEQLEDLEWAFGNMGLQDKAKHLATLYLEDLSDFIKECVDENFGFSRYAERLGMSANSFDELYEKLQDNLSYIDIITLDLLDKKLKQVDPKLVCFSVPFPGNLYSAFRSAQFIKKNYPHIKVAMGGGFPNSELRSVSDARVFDYFDYITLDDGELPIELLHLSLSENNSKIFKRTFLKENHKVVYNNTSVQTDYKQSEVGTPDYSDLFLDKYISVIEIANPMHSLWSDGRWNKLTMAHGCYWGKCTFCDISLDYIKIYEPIATKLLVDRMEELIAQTCETGFHFVDEAAPPALMKALALEIIRRKLVVTWWTNIRFEKNFTQDLCLLLKASGCIAVSGGLEVASDRLLALIDKGVTVEQVAKVTRHFTESGIMVHAYLMYGYPTQTEQETIDSLELVRQLFQSGVLQSGFWHQFALTAHSPIGLNPENFGVTPKYNDITFANNDIQFKDETGINHDKFSFGLKKSLYNYMHGVGFDLPLQKWFDFKIAKTKIDPDYIIDCIEKEDFIEVKPSSKIVWLGPLPVVVEKQSHFDFIFHNKVDSFTIELEKLNGEFLRELMKKTSAYNNAPVSYSTLKEIYEKDQEHFSLFWFSNEIETLRKNGLIVI